MNQPWIEGPLELLKHGLEHLKNDTDFDRRIAMISIDNSVELMIKTYLGLPRRITAKSVSRKEFEEGSSSFSKLLNLLEKYAPEKITGIDLGHIEWYHRLRNTLYHEGNGITIERGKAQGYAIMVKILFLNLFETDIEKFIGTIIQGKLDEFLVLYANLEKELKRLYEKYPIPLEIPKIYGKEYPMYNQLSDYIKRLEGSVILPDEAIQDYLLVRRFRNLIVHTRDEITDPDLFRHQVILERLIGGVRDAYQNDENAHMGEPFRLQIKLDESIFNVVDRHKDILISSNVNLQKSAIELIEDLARQGIVPEDILENYKNVRNCVEIPKLIELIEEFNQY